MQAKVYNVAATIELTMGAPVEQQRLLFEGPSAQKRSESDN